MKIIKLIALLLLVLAIAAALWFYRPWSDFSPAQISALQDPSRFPSTFRDMESYVPFSWVKKGNLPVRKFGEDNKSLNIEMGHQGASKALETFLQESTTTALIVIKDGVIRHEQYRLGSSSDSRFTSWSVAKSFVATAVMSAHEQGLIESLDDTAYKYAPQYAGTDFGQTSIKGLLAMSSGVEFKEDYFADDSDILPFFFNSFVLGRNPDTLLKPFKRTRPEFSDFHYISPNSHVLSAVLRGIYKKPLAQIISEQLWQPLGMEADATWLQHKPGLQGQALGYCCLNARLRDYARFGQFYVDAMNGRNKTQLKLSPQVLQSLTEPASAAHAPGQGTYAGRGYSWHFWLPERTRGVFMASGVYGQYIWMQPKDNLVIVKTSADPDFLSRFAETESMFRAIAAHYVTGAPAAQSTPAIEPVNEAE